MKVLTFSILFLATAGTAIAQVQSTSPGGYVATGGDATISLGTDNSSFFPFTLSASQIDATVIGQPQSIGTISLRRSAIAAASSAYAAQTATITVRMAHGDFAAITGSSQTVQSLLTTPWTTVVQPRPLNLPDLTNPPASAPAPWNVPITLDAPFAYNGTDALVYQILLHGTGMTLPIPFDAIDGSFVGSNGSAFGTGCQSTQGPFEAFAQFRVSGTQDTSIDLRTTPQMIPSLGAINLLSIGFGPANTPTGLCTGLTNTNEIVMPLTGSTFGGANPANVPGREVTVPHDPVWIGTEIFVQGWSVETSNPGVLIGSTSYRSGPYPAPPTNPTQVAFAFGAFGGFAPQFATDGTFAVGRGLIVGLEP